MALQIRAKVDGVQLGANRAGRNDKITLTVQGIPINVLVELTKRYKQNVVLELVEVEQPDLFDEDGEPNPSAEMADAAERFWIDEGSFPIHRDAEDETSEYRLTGKELRELVEPPADQIWQVLWDGPENERRVLVEDSALIPLNDGDKFTTQVEADLSEDGASPLNDSEAQYAAIGTGRGRGAE